MGGAGEVRPLLDATEGGGGGRGPEDPGMLELGAAAGGGGFTPGLGGADMSPVCEEVALGLDL